MAQETPPLTRGRHKANLSASRIRRNTPAYAGKTPWEQRGSLRGWKHPRLRGEDPLNGAGNFPVMETPPLTRGRLENRRTPKRNIGNTPAYAGKTRGGNLGEKVLRKHPRLRGEDTLSIVRTVAMMETPPLTRGRLSSYISIGKSDGNTPAYAGKTATFCGKIILKTQNVLLIIDLSVFH